MTLRLFRTFQVSFEDMDDRDRADVIESWINAPHVPRLGETVIFSDLSVWRVTGVTWKVDSPSSPREGDDLNVFVHVKRLPFTCATDPE